jgi:hypothetical protein
MNKNIFKEDFLNVKPESIINAINERGFFCYEKALDDGFLKSLTSDLELYSPSINKNIASPVWSNTQYYFTHALAASQNYFDLLTSKFIRSIAKSKFDNYFRLKCHRYYETYYGHSMEWHADNVTNEGVVTDIDGLIFIIYINDVFDGEFQLIKGTNKERKEIGGTYNYTNKLIQENYSKQIETFSMKAGSIIIYDTFHIHRAKPILDKKYVRKSIFFQIDSSNSHSEKLLINPEFFKNQDSIEKENMDYLGFGKEAEFDAIPVTDERDLPISQIKNFFFRLLRALVVNIYRKVIDIILSHDQKMKYYEYRRKQKK